MLTQSLKNTAEYKKLLDAVTNGRCPAALFGLPPAGRAQLLCALAEDVQRPFVLLCPGEAEATRFAQDLNTLGLPAGIYPARDFVLRNIEGQSHEYEYRRLQVLGDLVGGRIRVLVRGRNLQLRAMNPTDLVITGEICAVELDGD